MPGLPGPDRGGPPIPLDFEIDVASRVIFIRLAGAVSPEEIYAYPPMLLEHPDYDPSFAELIDCRHADGSALSGQSLRRMAAINRAEFDEIEHRIAYVVSEDLAFGLVRQYLMLSKDAPAARQVFRGIDEAREWLGLSANDTAD
jgi:hypothetical protein